MAISKEFLLGEIQSLESEIEKAQIFLTQAQAVLNTYRMLLVKFDEPEPIEPEVGNGSNLSSSS